MKFGVRESQIVKGVSVILLFIHHVFYLEERAIHYAINFCPLTMAQGLAFAQVCKVCVGIFAFITAYGITRKSDMTAGGIPQAKSTMRRMVNLMLGFQVVFVLSQPLYLLGRNFFEIYEGGSPLLNFLLDFLGLANAFKTPSFNNTWWYMSLAYAIVLTVPFLLRAYSFSKGSIVFMAFLMPRLLNITESSMYIRYLPCIITGIWCAKTAALEKMKAFRPVNNKYVSVVLKVAVAAVALVALCYARQKLVAMYDIWDALIPLMLSFLCFQVLAPLPGISAALAFLGKHSLNMFLTHTFIYSYYFRDFTYSFRHAWLIILVLLGISLVLSMAIEQIKKWIRIDNIAEKLIGAGKSPA